MRVSRTGRTILASPRVPTGLLLSAVLVLACVAGCQSAQRTASRPGPDQFALADTGGGMSVLEISTERDLTPPRPDGEVLARVTPPVGWQPDPIKSSDRHTHEVWISPSGSTAYGVSHFSHFLLFLASDDRVLAEVLKGMKQTSGETQLLASQKDKQIDGLRFVANSGPYTVYGNLIRRGTDGWVVYAGTMRDKPVAGEELRLAEVARDRTEPGLE
jgi:hypothetical protein